MTVGWLIDRLKQEDPDAVIVRPTRASLNAPACTPLIWEHIFPPEYGKRFYNQRSKRVYEESRGGKAEVPAVIFLA